MPREVCVPGTRIRFVGLAGWIDHLADLTARPIASSPHYARIAAVARALDLSDIRSCTDLETLERAGEYLTWARQTGKRFTYVLGRPAIGAMLVEIHNQARRVRSGAHRQPRRRPGPRFDPRLLPDDRLLHLIQTIPDTGRLELLRAERLRRERE